MSLATVIRLEFAYPGVGILAGDSIQYLSIATAHGVIMVFFMIMPAVFGAFGNFLLPTQLGVHDVAFPRLNSAAFWFLPGGLIMLCQLVCVDRRYQRMNCFNIRELQGILKRKFFTDLVNSNDHRTLLDKSVIGLRFKNNNQLNINHDMSLFYNFGTTTSSKAKTGLFTNNYLNSQEAGFTGKASLFLVNIFNNITSMNSSNTGTLTSPLSITNVCFNISLFVTSSLSSLASISASSLIAMITLPSMLKDFFAMNFNLNFSSQNNNSFTNLTGLAETNGTIFSSDNLTTLDSSNNFTNSMSELSTTLRFTRFNNPLISYDYKCGNYLGIWDQLYPSLMTSFIEVARGIRKAP